MQWSIHPVFHIDLLTPYRETPMHGPNYQRPPPELVEGTEEYEVKKILDSQKFSRGRKLQYLVKWKGYPDSENQWVDKSDVFADEAVQEFKQSNPASEAYIRTLREPYVLTIPTSAKSMSSPAPSTIENVILASDIADTYEDASHQEFCRALTAFVGPVPGRVSPDFLEEQRDGSTEDEEDAEDVQDVEGRTDLQGVLALQSVVRIPSTSDISAIRCSHSCDPDYCHNCADARWHTTEDSHAIFVRPPGTPQHPMGSLDGVSPTCTQGEEPLYWGRCYPIGTYPQLPRRQ